MYEPSYIRAQVLGATREGEASFASDCTQEAELEPEQEVAQTIEASEPWRASVARMY